MLLLWQQFGMFDLINIIRLEEIEGQVVMSLVTNSGQATAPTYHQALVGLNF